MLCRAAIQAKTGPNGPPTVAPLPPSGVAMPNGLFPLGEEESGHVIAIDEHGRFFVIDEAGAWFVGADIDVALGVSIVSLGASAGRSSLTALHAFDHTSHTPIDMPVTPAQ